MKPTMEGKAKQSEIVINQPSAEVSPRRPNSKRLVLAVVCLVAAVVVVGIVLGSVYLLSALNKEAYKEAWVTLINKDKPEETIKERVKLTEAEADVLRPGVYRFVVEKRQNKIVILRDLPEVKDELEPCLVADLDTSIATNTTLDDEQVTRTVSFEKCSREYRSTEEEVDITTLSPRAQDMCLGRKVLKAVDTTDTQSIEDTAVGDRVRRGEIKVSVRIGRVTVTVTVRW